MWEIGFRSAPPSTYLKSEYSLAFLVRAFAVRKNHLLSLLLRKRFLKSGSISLAWALLCLHNLDAVFMQSGPFVVLNSLQLNGCAFNDVRWRTVMPMPLFGSSLVSHKRSSPLAAHIQEPCHFLFVFSFSYTGPRSGELRTQKLKSHLVRTQSLNVLPLKPRVGQYIAKHATLTARDFFLDYFYPSGPFTCIFFKTSPNFSCGGCG